MGEGSTAGDRETSLHFTASDTDESVASDANSDTTTADNSGPDDSSGDDSGDALIAEEVQSLLESKCGGCHGAGGPGAGGIDYITDLAALVAQKKVERGSPETSRIFIRITSADNPMPPAAQNDPLSTDEIDLVRRWILSGAPAGPTPANCADNVFISADEMIEEMTIDILFDVDPADRPFTRYLTLTHLHNSGLCPDVLDAYEAAISKLVNSLSRETFIARPLRFGPQGTLLRIDLRDYGWHENAVLLAKGFADVWEATVIANPFAVEFAGEFADDLKTQAQTGIPFQSADSFLQLVSRGGLYYDILKIPSTADALEVELQVGDPNDPNSLTEGEIVRASFRESGVSSNNRMIERRRTGLSSQRSYWRSFDFASSAGAADLFAEPITFVADGGEIIFNLENGMQAYMLVDGDGDRVDVAPTEIVRDPAQRDSVVKNGISCMACHDAGIIPKADEFRAFYEDAKSEFPNQAERDLIELLYPGDEAVAAAQAFDAGIFKEAMKAADVPVGVAEPIIAASLSFEANIDLRRAAAELGVTEERLDHELNGLDLSLRSLRFTTISRDTFTAAFRDALCAINPGDNLPVCPNGQ